MEVQPLSKKIAFEKITTGSVGKFTALLILGTGFAFSFVWFLELFLKSGDWNHLIFSAISAILFLIVYLFQSLFIKINGRLAFMVFIESLAMTAVFINRLFLLLPLVLIIFLVLYSGNYSGKKDLENRLKINFRGISKIVLPKGIVVIALMFSVIIPFSLRSDAQKFPLPPGVFKEIFSITNPIIQKFLPGVDLSLSLEEIAKTTAEEKISRISGTQNLPKAAKQQIINQSLNDFYKKISDFIGTQINPKQSVSDSLYGAIKEKFFKLSESAKDLIFILIGVLILASIESVALPIRLFVSFLAFMAYKILLALNFFRISFEDRTKEVILID